VREADNLPPYSADVKKSKGLNSPRPFWACMACNGCDLPFYIIVHVYHVYVLYDDEYTIEGAGRNKFAAS
jgi:hypothetical protein